MSDDDVAATHLGRLGLNPITVARLRSYAEDDGMSLRQLAIYVLSDYTPADVADGAAGDHPGPESGT